MTATTTRREFYESGEVARRLSLSVARVHQLAEEFGLPLARTTRGLRLWTERDVEALQRAREERAAARAVDRGPRAA